MTYRTATIVALVGGVLMALGSFMPWISARTGFGGTDIAGTSGDGVFSLGLGAIVALIALVQFDRQASGLARTAVVVAGLLGLGIAVLDYSNISQRIAAVTSTAISASVGAGLYVLLIGCIAAIIGGWRMRAYASSVPQTVPTIAAEAEDVT